MKFAYRKSLLTAALLSYSLNASATLVCSNVVEGGYITEVQSWNVGDAHKLALSLPVGDLTCAADGIELNYIRTRFTGLPMVLKGGGPVVWKGDNAEFILDNL